MQNRDIERSSWFEMRRKKLPVEAEETFEREGLSVRRVGKSVQWSLHRTPEEHAQFKRRLWTSRARITENIRSSARELSELVQKYSSFDLVANLWLKNGIFNPETYREWDAPQRPYHIEYTALLELKSNEARLTPELIVSPKDVSRAGEIIEGILRDTMWYQTARNADPRITPDTEALRRAQFFGMFRYTVVGPPAYTQHWIDVLDGLFSDAELQPAITEGLGISYPELRALVDVAASRMGEKVVERVGQARTELAKLEANLARYMATGRWDGSSDEKSVLDRFRNMRAKDRKRAMQSMIWSWAFVALADQLSFTAEDLV